MNKMIITELRDRASCFLKKVSIVLVSYYLGICGAYCGIFEKAESATTTVTTNLLSLAKKIFPLSLVICVVALFVTHDERKLQLEIKIGIGLCVGYVVLLLATNGTIAATLDGWFS